MCSVYPKVKAVFYCKECKVNFCVQAVDQHTKHDFVHIKKIVSELSAPWKLLQTQVNKILNGNNIDAEIDSKVKDNLIKAQKKATKVLQMALDQDVASLTEATNERLNSYREHSVEAYKLAVKELAQQRKIANLKKAKEATTPQVEPNDEIKAIDQPTQQAQTKDNQEQASNGKKQAKKAKPQTAAKKEELNQPASTSTGVASVQFEDVLNELRGEIISMNMRINEQDQKIKRVQDYFKDKLKKIKTKQKKLKAKLYGKRHEHGSQGSQGSGGEEQSEGKKETKTRVWREAEDLESSEQNNDLSQQQDNSEHDDASDYDDL